MTSGTGHLPPHPTDRGPPNPSLPTDPPLTSDLAVLLPAHPTSQREARHHLQRWLAEHGCPIDVADDLVLALSEAVANVVDHAYPHDALGQVELNASITTATSTAVEGMRSKQVIVSITDAGRWREPDAARSAASRRGHGLRLIGELIAQLYLQHDDAGTTVVMVSRPVAATIHPLA
jgi:serine/threonine-protein kinase RsbW